MSSFCTKSNHTGGSGGPPPGVIAGAVVGPIGALAVIGILGYLENLALKSFAAKPASKGCIVSVSWPMVASRGRAWSGSHGRPRRRVLKVAEMASEKDIASWSATTTIRWRPRDKHRL